MTTAVFAMQLQCSVKMSYCGKYLSCSVLSCEQVLGPILVGVSGAVWVVCAVLFYKWKKLIKRRQHALRLRNRVQLHAFAIDVLKYRPKPGDLLASSSRQQLFEQLHLLHAWFDNSYSDNTLPRFY